MARWMTMLECGRDPSKDNNDCFDICEDREECQGRTIFCEVKDCGAEVTKAFWYYRVGDVLMCEECWMEWEKSHPNSDEAVEDFIC